MSRHLISMSIVVIALGMLPWIRGGYPIWPQALFGMAIAIALALAPPSRSSHRDPLWTLSLVIWTVWLVWQICQILPIPSFFQVWLPQQLTEIQLNAALTGVRLESRISHAPTSGVQQGIASLSLFCLYLAVRSLLRTHAKWRRPFLATIVFLGFSQAMYGTLVQLTAWEIPWLEPSPPAHLTVAHGTFPNRNHFAAYLVLAFACALALLLGSSTRSTMVWQSTARRLIDVLNSPAVIVRVSMLGIVIGIVLSHSRMGNASLAAGISTFALLWLIRPGSNKKIGRTILLFLSIAAIDVLLVSQHFGLQRVLQRIEDTTLESGTRATARDIAWKMIDRYSWSGAGHGSTKLLEYDFKPGPHFPSLYHLHNDHLELVVEFGWVGYGLLASLLATHIWMAFRLFLSNRAMHQACGAAFIMIAVAEILHATVEYQFHIPGWRAMFVALMGLVAAFPRHQHSAFTLSRSKLSSSRTAVAS